MAELFRNTYECSDDQIAAAMRRISENYIVEIEFGEQEDNPRKDFHKLDQDKILLVKDRAFQNSGVLMIHSGDGINLIWSPWAYASDTMISFKIARDIEALICQEGGRAVGKPVAAYEWVAKLRRYSIVQPFICWLFAKLKKRVGKPGRAT